MSYYYLPQHPVQEKLLALSAERNLGAMTLREIGALVGVKSAQVVKHHLHQLELKGLVTIDRDANIVARVKKGLDRISNFANVPILGAADCGPARQIADARPQGYIKISKKILKNGKGIFAVRAHGHSMNRARIKTENKIEKNIEDGDYVLIDSKYVKPKNGDYVLSVVDGMANIKKYVEDRENEQIVLVSESTKDYPPIYIHWNEAGDCVVNGRVVDVIKKPKI